MSIQVSTPVSVCLLNIYTTLFLSVRFGSAELRCEINHGAYTPLKACETYRSRRSLSHIQSQIDTVPLLEPAKKGDQVQMFCLNA